MRLLRRHRRCAVPACLLAGLLTGFAAAPAAASQAQESMFQDDALLVFPSHAQVARTLDTLRYLGVDRIRVTVFWNLIAPDPSSPHRPGFAATDPASYPPGAWDRYDSLVKLARARGIDVNFNVAPPAPLWAQRGGTGNMNYVGHYRPDAGDFARFMVALGIRYSGSYVPPGPGAHVVPRVSYWSLWNEPNGVHFLAPPWASARGRNFESAAAIYRSLVDGAYSALRATGHGADTILVGETAPSGQPGPGQNHSTRPLRFIRALYCVDSHLRPLRGIAAAVLSCPQRNQARAFPGAHPGLFAATGFAHHPYQLLLAPTTHGQRDSVSTADLGRLTGTLDRVFRAYRQLRRLPIYYTEYGYETRPPNPFGVSLATQAAYINQAEFMAYRSPRVRSYTQFLLLDSPYRNLFDTGLQTSRGKLKPSFSAYRTAIFVPQTFSRGGRFRVWGLLRPGRRGGVRTAAIQFRAFGGRRFGTVATEPVARGRGYVDSTVRVPASGVIRLAWRDPASGRQAFSRGVAVFR